jgi:hypothetical protein
MVWLSNRYFSEFDDSHENLERLTDSLSKFNIEEQVFFCNQDFEDFFCELQQIGLDEKIGVYFYDASYNYRSQLLALLLVKPFLADKALIVLSNANSAQVQQAASDFIATNPQCQLVLDLQTRKLFDEKFWNGISIFTWDKHRINNDPAYIQYRSHNKFVLESLRETELRQKESVSNLFREAGILTHGHRYTEAEQKFKTILLMKHKCGGLAAVGNYLLPDGKISRSNDTLTKSLESDPSQAALHSSFGLVLEKYLL